MAPTDESSDQPTNEQIALDEYQFRVQVLTGQATIKEQKVVTLLVMQKKQKIFWTRFRVIQNLVCLL